MPTSELRVPNALSTTAQTVQDEAGTNSALMIATNAVLVTPPVLENGRPSLIVNAPAATLNAPAVQVNSLSAESAIRFFTATDNAAFHIGVGGNAGPGTFFFFSGQAPGTIVMKIEQDGDVRIEKNLSIGGTLSVGALNGAQTRVLNVPPAKKVLSHLMIEPATGELFVQ